MGTLYGECTYPVNGGPGAVTIREGLAGSILLDTLIHELLHAAYPELAEGRVRRGATDIARVLWRAGYRLPNDP